MCRKKERKKTTVVFFLPSLLVSLFGLALVSPYVILHLILLFYLYFTLYFLNSFLSLSYGVYGVYLSFPLQLVAGGTFFFSFCSSGGTKGRRQRATRPHTRILNSLPNFTSARPPRPKANVSICQCKWERERDQKLFFSSFLPQGNLFHFMSWLRVLRLGDSDWARYLPSKVFFFFFA